MPGLYTAAIKKSKETKTTKTFLGRNDELRIFKNFINDHKTKKVLYYYGVGGIGKSRLIGEFTSRLKADSSKIPLLFEFDTEKDSINSIRNELDFYAEARKQLKLYNVTPFIHFDIAFMIYTYNTKRLLNAESIRFFEKNEQYEDMDDALESYMEKYHLEVQPFSEVISTVVEALDEVEPSLKISVIQHFFLKDLNLFSHQNPSKIIFLLDTYEAIQLNKSEDNNPSRHWLETIFLAMEHASWIICGRENSIWFNDTSEMYMQSFQLQNLGYDESEQFLINEQINEEDVIKAIFNATSGYPLMLTLAKNIYFALKEQGISPTAEDFKQKINDTEAFTKRLLRFISKEERHTLEYLSVTNYWNYSLYKKLLNKFDLKADRILFKRLKRFSFIEQNGEEYTFHKVIREVLLKILKQSDPYTYIEIEGFLWDNVQPFLLANSKVIKSEILQNPKKQIRFFEQGYHHGMQALQFNQSYLQLEDFFEWVRKIDAVFLYSHQNELTLNLLYDFKSYLAHIDFEKYTKIDYDIAYIHMHELRQYEKAETMFKIILSERTIKLGDRHSLTAKAYFGLGVLNGLRGNIEEGIHFHEIGLALRKQIYDTERDKVHKNNWETNTWAIALSENSLARLYLDEGSLEKAYPLLKSALNRYNEVFVRGQDEKLLEELYASNYLTTMANYFICLMKYEQYSQALDHAATTLDKVKKYKNEDYFYMARAHQYLGIAQLKSPSQEENNNALYNFNKAKEYLTQHFGEKDRLEMAKLLHNYTIAYFMIDKEQSLTYLQATLAMKKRLLEMGIISQKNKNYIETQRLKELLDTGEALFDQLEFNY